MLERTLMKTILASTILAGFGMQAVHAETAWDGPATGLGAVADKSIVVLRRI